MRLAAVLVLLLGLFACGNDDASRADADEPIPLVEIDRSEWMEDLVAVGVCSPTCDLDRLYKLVADSCQEDDASLRIGLTLVGADPDVDRVNFRHVCPSQVYRIDDALDEIADTTAETERLCAMDPAARTADEQERLDAIYDEANACS